MASRVLTVMFTDIKGFTERTSNTSRLDLRNLLEEHEKLLLPVSKRFGGTLIKTIGDALLLTFESPTNAVLCGMMMQETLRVTNEEKADEDHIRIRVAINTGEVELRDGDIFGEAVNIASRIEGIAEAGDIYFTESVYLAMNKSEVPSSSIGERRLKGIPEAIKVYSVIQDPNSASFQELIRKLKEGKFDDVELPSTGVSASAAVIRPVAKSRAPALVGAIAVVFAIVAAVVLMARDPVGDARKSVQEALDAGDLGLASSRAQSMKQRFPESESALETVRAVNAAVFEDEKKKIADALAAGKTESAITQADVMIAKYSGDDRAHEIMRTVVSAETDGLIEKERWKDAQDLLKTRKEERTWLNIDPYRKRVILAEAAKWHGEGQMALAGNRYSRLMNDYPKDLEIRKAIVEKMGPSNKYGTYKIAVHAAMDVAEGTTGTLDEVLTQTLIDGMDEWYPEYKYAVQARKLLAERAPNCVEKLRKIVVSPKPDKHESDWANSRANAVIALREMKKLNPDDELQYHFTSLISFRTVHRRYLEAAAAYFETAIKDPSWSKRRVRLNIQSVKDVPSQTRFSDTQKKVAAVLVKGFRPEIDELLIGWAKNSKDFEVRVNAYGMLKEAGIADRADAWTYHQKNLMEFDPTFTPVAFREALDYFGAVKDKKPEAAEALAACRARIAKLLKWYEKNKSKGWIERAKINIGLIDKAVQSLQG